MNCRNVSALLPLEVGDDLSPRQRARVVEHLRACAQCQRERAALRASRAAFQEQAHAADGPLVPPVDDFTAAMLRQRVMLHVRGQAPRQGALARLGRWAQSRTATAAAAGAGAALALIAVLVALSPRSQPATAAMAVEDAHPKADPGATRHAEAPVAERDAPLWTHADEDRARATRESLLARNDKPQRAVELTSGDPTVRIIWLVRADEAPPREVP